MKHNVRLLEFNMCAMMGAASLITGLFASISVGAQSEKAPQRIVFARGATTARATGYLRGRHDSASFVLRATAGQHMRIEIDARGATHGGVFSPSGQGGVQPGGVVFDDTINETGDYRIVVSESQMAELWRGNFALKIAILPRGVSSPATANYEKYGGKYP